MAVNSGEVTCANLTRLPKSVIDLKAVSLLGAVYVLRTVDVALDVGFIGVLQGHVPIGV